MRRIAVVPAITALVFGFGVGGAAPAGARPLIETSSVSFTLSSATCSNLPAGTTISGSGIERSVTTTKTHRSGVTTVINATIAYGVATDGLNVYVFNYENEFRASNSVANLDLLKGLMTDHFSLSGSGPATLNNGFVAHFTAASDFSTFSAQPISQHGDPISFPDGAAHCDPL